MSDHKSDMAG